MKERQDSLAARIAGTIAGGVRRRQQDRLPRAVVYDSAGEPRIVPAGSDAQAALLEAAEELVEIALEGAAPEALDAAAADDDAADAPDPAAADDAGSPAPARDQSNE